MSHTVVLARPVERALPPSLVVLLARTQGAIHGVFLVVLLAQSLGSTLGVSLAVSLDLGAGLSDSSGGWAGLPAFGNVAVVATRHALMAMKSDTRRRRRSLSGNRY